MGVMYNNFDHLYSRVFIYRYSLVLSRGIDFIHISRFVQDLELPASICSFLGVLGISYKGEQGLI